MFLIADLQTVFPTRFVGMFMIYVRVKFDISVADDPLLRAVKLKAKLNLSHDVMLAAVLHLIKIPEQMFSKTYYHT